ncbi:MAG TPA: Lrp/AsnC family transcriptional regulator [Kiloniellales bacterium]|nr:Lrp/AsnC family transcriptional regulator [Kiloniellales bacterium]
MRGPKPDAIDFEILAALQREGRMTKAALAERVSLSPTPCWERLKRLEKAGLIRGYHADIALEKLAPLTTLLVEVTLEQHRYQDFELFERHVRRIDEIVECHATGGGIDYLLKVVVPDIDAYQRLIDGLLTAGLGIDRYFTYVVTRPIKTALQAPVALVRPRRRADSKGSSAAGD